MSTQLSKEALRFRAAERRMLRWLRRLVDWADESLHRWEVAQRQPAVEQVPDEKNRLRTAYDGETQSISSAKPTVSSGNPLTWEKIQRVNAKPVAKRKRRMTAAEFDQKYAGFAGVGLAR